MAAPRFQRPRAAPKSPVTPAQPIISRRALDLEREGAGPAPCMTAAHTWLGCQSSRDTDDVCLATGRRCCMVRYQRPVVESGDLAEDVENIKRLVKPTKGHF